MTDHRDHVHYPFRDLPYDEGGLVDARTTRVLNILAVPEPVLSAEDWEKYTAEHPE